MAIAAVVVVGNLYLEEPGGTWMPAITSAV